MTKVHGFLLKGNYVFTDVFLVRGRALDADAMRMRNIEPE